MRKFHILNLLLTLLFFSRLAAEDISGFWQTLDDNTNKPSSVIAIYPYQGNYYGRIIAIYNDQGVLDDTIYHPKSKAPGIAGNPYYCGLDIVWHAVPTDEDKYKGYVVDPKRGKVYDAELWKQDGNVILRGEVFIFGKNVVWPPFPETKFNKNFKKPNLKTFVPKNPYPPD